MKKENFSAGKLNIVFILLVLFASSCVPVRQLSYFNDIEELEKPVVNPKTQKTILPFDRLYIRILSIDPLTREIFNIPDEVRYSPSSNALIGYLVDENGDIEFPFVGKINVGSLTLEQAGNKIEQALGEYVANTTILVKFIDNQVS
ncbi:MAG TPA: polysaccharide biosynthesis/export family protein, partial [Bacteroidales bacterium]|nr:polysaccharide biosynthesis/export family protein [Bacteroidales bacterium]